MSYLEIFLLSLALSVDACVVSFSYGLAFKDNRLKNSLLLALFTGLFQGIMPCFGYYLTGFVKSFIAPYASYIVFAIFLYLGVKFIIESFEESKNKSLCIDISCLLMIGIATSIDAFTAGVSLALYGNKILKPAILIAFITFVNSILGFWVGGKLQKMSCRLLEITAGITLIGLGVKALF